MGDSPLRSIHRSGIRAAVVVGAGLMLAIAALVISMSESGNAAYPGLNGKIAYSYGDAYQASIWAANPDGSAPVRLTNGTSDYSASYSPNGTRLVFSRDGGIAVMNADGSGLAQLIAGTESSSAGEPKWVEEYPNPNKPGEKIPVVRIQTFTQTWLLYSSPSFSPDATTLAVALSQGKTIETSICSVATNGSNECLDYEDPDAYFDYEYECVGCTSHIVTVSAASGAITGQVTPPSATSEDWGPSYSSKGAIAFARWSGKSGTASIYVAGSPGVGPVQVTGGPYDYSPDFSPDGARIAFVRQGDMLGMVGTGGGPVSAVPIPLPAGAVGQSTEAPAFSPDGTKLTFERYVNLVGPGPNDTGVYTVGTDGVGLTKILNEAEVPTWQPIPPPPPAPVAVAAKAKAKKGKIKLDKKYRALLGSIQCGTSPCKLTLLSSKLKAGGTKCSAQVKLPKKLAAGKSTKVKATFQGKCLAALKAAGKGKLLTKVKVIDALGKHTLKFRSKLLAPEASKKET